MAEIVTVSTRSTKVVGLGDIVFDPPVGALQSPPMHPYTGTLTITVGNAQLRMDQAEFDDFAYKMSVIAICRRSLNERS